MAQTQAITNQGLTELVLLASSAAATPFSDIVCLSSTGTCTASTASTYADPAGDSVHHAGSGLSIVAAATCTQVQTNTTGDTISYNHVFTASGAANVSGVHICNGDNDVTLAECCFNAVVAMESSDTLTVAGSVVTDQV